MIKRQHITEKTSILQSLNCYTLIIEKNVNKIELTKHIETTYKVKVNKVNILKKPSKSRRRGKVVGKTSEHKKAYVYTEEKIKEFEES